MQYLNLNENALRDLLKELNLPGCVCSFEREFLFPQKMAVLSTAGDLYDFLLFYLK